MGAVRVCYGKRESGHIKRFLLFLLVGCVRVDVGVLVGLVAAPGVVKRLEDFLIVVRPIDSIMHSDAPTRAAATCGG